MMLFCFFFLIIKCITSCSFIKLSMFIEYHIFIHFQALFTDIVIHWIFLWRIFWVILSYKSTSNTFLYEIFMNFSHMSIGIVFIGKSFFSNTAWIWNRRMYTFHMCAQIIAIFLSYFTIFSYSWFWLWRNGTNNVPCMQD